MSDFAATVKQQADIVRIVGDYVKLRKAGAQNFVGLCPFHGEKTASFSVHATRQFFYCFGCAAKGDVFTFVQKIENITFPEAVRLVAQKLGIAVPKMTPSSPEEAREARIRGVLLDIHERACAWFQDQLRRPEGAHAREYLAGRGLSPETIAQFRIGYAPDSGFLLRDAMKRDFDEETMKESGLFSWKEDGSSAVGDRPSGKPDSEHPKADGRKPIALYSKFRNRVLFPICNETGRVIAFTGRTLATDEKSGPKYLNSPETPIYSKSRVLFNLDKGREAIRKLDYCILVEGQMDCISVYAAGFHNVIASSGTAFTDAQARLLARYSHKIVVNFDPDTAGAAAAERSLALLVAEDFEIKVLTLEQGFDPDLFIRRKGAPAYVDALRHAPRYFDFLIGRAQKQFPVRTPEGKVKALNYLLPHIHRVPSRIVRDELAQEIAHKLQIDSTVLRQELRHAAGERRVSSIHASAEVQITPAERILIRALAGEAQLSADTPASVREGEDHEFDSAHQARMVLESERLHEGLAAEAIVDSLLGAPGADLMSLDLSEAQRRLIADVLMRDGEELTPELLEGAFEALRRRRLERRQRDLKVEIAEAERRGDSAALGRLMQEKVAADRALAGLHVRTVGIS
ncbi:MAG TPA: DNA primase [Terriglobales bacterium]|nr:DNA primase [Terriglobales bacterium]